MRETVATERLTGQKGSRELRQILRGAHNGAQVMESRPAVARWLKERRVEGNDFQIRFNGVGSEVITMWTCPPLEVVSALVQNAGADLRLDICIAGKTDMLTLLVSGDKGGGQTELCVSTPNRDASQNPRYQYSLGGYKGDDSESYLRKLFFASASASAGDYVAGELPRTSLYDGMNALSKSRVCRVRVGLGDAPPVHAATTTPAELAVAPLAYHYMPEYEATLRALPREVDDYTQKMGAVAVIAGCAVGIVTLKFDMQRAPRFERNPAPLLSTLAQYRPRGYFVRSELSDARLLGTAAFAYGRAVAFSPFALSVTLGSGAFLDVQLVRLQFVATGDAPYNGGWIGGIKCSNRHPCWYCSANWLQMRQRLPAPVRTRKSLAADLARFERSGDKSDHHSVVTSSLMPFIKPTAVASVLHPLTGESSRGYKLIWDLAEKGDSLSDSSVREHQRQTSEIRSQIAKNGAALLEKKTQEAAALVELRAAQAERDGTRERVRPQRNAGRPAHLRSTFAAENEASTHHIDEDAPTQAELDAGVEKADSRLERAGAAMVVAVEAREEAERDGRVLVERKDALAAGKTEGACTRALRRAAHEHAIQALAYFDGKTLNGHSARRMLRAAGDITSTLMEELARLHALETPSWKDSIVCGACYPPLLTSGKWVVAHSVWASCTGIARAIGWRSRASR